MYPVRSTGPDRLVVGPMLIAVVSMMILNVPPAVLAQSSCAVADADANSRQQQIAFARDCKDSLVSSMVQA